MNETRKEIINLIQDYMDKTLDKWCLCNVSIQSVNSWDWITTVTDTVISEYLGDKIETIEKDFKWEVFLDLEIKKPSLVIQTGQMLANTEDRQT